MVAYPWAGRQGLVVSRQRWRASSTTELVAAAGEVRRLGRVAGELDGAVVRRAGVVAAADATEEVGAGGVEGVVAGQRVREPVDGREGDVGAVELGDGDRAVERHD